MKSRPDCWTVKLYSREQPGDDESALLLIPVPDDRWPLVTAAILDAWRSGSSQEVRADIYDPTGTVMAQFGYDELDLPDTDASGFST